MENERAEWMWRMSERMWKMSERSRVDVEIERTEWMWTISEEDKVLFAFTKKILEIHSYVFLFCIDKCRNMSQSLKVSRRSKFGVGGADAGRTVWRVADNLEKTLLCKFLFSLANFLN